MPTLTPQGLIVERADELRDGILDDLETMPGVGTIDRTRLDRRVDGQFASVVADRLDDLGQALLAVRDARSPNNATGRQLDDLAEVTGTFRDPATYSTAVAALSRDPAHVPDVFVPAGKIIENASTGERWILAEDVTIPGSPSILPGYGTVRAESPGPVTAGAGDLTKIVTGVTGWALVSNAAAVVGRSRETDAELRVRRLQELAKPGGGTTNAIRAALIALEPVTAAVVISNNSITPATVQGVPLPAASLAAYVWPDTLSTDERQEVAEVLWTKGPAGIEQVGGELGTVTDAAGGVQEVRWEWATEVALVAAVCTVVLRPGFALVDVEEAIQRLIVKDAADPEAPAGYFDRLTVGQTVSVLELSCEIADNVPGVAGLAFTFDDGGGPAAGDYSPAVTEIVTLDVANLTVTT